MNDIRKLLFDQIAVYSDISDRNILLARTNSDVPRGCNAS